MSERSLRSDRPARAAFAAFASALVACHGPDHFFCPAAIDVAVLEHQARLGCFTLSAGVIERWRAALKGLPLALVLENGCERTVEVDLRALRVVGVDARGNRRALTPFDPRHELRIVSLAPGAQGQERIEYLDDEAPSATGATGAAWAQVCLDATNVLPEVPRGQEPRFCLDVRPRERAAAATGATREDGAAR